MSVRQFVSAEGLKWDTLEINLTEHCCIRQGEKIRLTRLEGMLLGVLVERIGQIVPQKVLLERVWGNIYQEESRYLLHTQISRLRRKLENTPTNPCYLLTESGIGYRLAKPALSQTFANLPYAFKVSGSIENLTSNPANFDDKLETICQLFSQPQVRMLTLVGPIALNKTQLALQIAGKLQPRFSDGIFSINLAALRSPEQLISYLTTLLNAGELPEGALLDWLKTYLAGKNLLLLLDNFEHLLAAAPYLADLLASVPQLKILVTSYSLLKIRGEYSYIVP